MDAEGIYNGFSGFSLKKGVLSCELAREFGCQQRSAWLWKAKIQEAMKSSGKHQLTGKVEVDEFLVGGIFTRRTRQGLAARI